MTNDEYTRRDFLSAVGGTSFAGTLIPHRSSIDTGDTDVSPEDLLVPESGVPSDFDSIALPEESPFVQALREADETLAGADMATKGYLEGIDPQNPKRVLASFATVCETAPPREAVQTAGTTCHEEHVRLYRTKGRSDLTCVETQQHNAAWSEWRIAVSLDRPPVAGETQITATEFMDTFRVLYRGRVVLGTLVFGPLDGTLSMDRMLNRAAKQQTVRLSQVISA